MFNVSILFKTCLLLLLLLCCCKVNIAQIITTYAGNGTVGYSGDGGLSVNSTLSFPYGINGDATGNLYVADRAGQIRKIDTKTNIITTYLVPNLYGPGNVAFDKSGNMYVSDAIACCIRKIDAVTKKETIIAGIPGTENTYYNVNGRDENAPATGAAFDYPAGITVDDSGNVYVADTYDSRVRKIDAKTGLIHTVAGGNNSGLEDDGNLATDVWINFPHDLAWGPDGNLYIAAAGEHTILKLDLKSGMITRIAGIHNLGGYVYAIGYTGDGGPAREAKLNGPEGICFDQAGNLLIADTHNNVIRKVDKNGIITTVAGTGAPGYSGDCGPALQATFQNPTNVFVDNNGILYITDASNHAVRKITNDKPNLIAGSSDICINSTVQLTNEAVNGVWQSSQPGVAAIDATGKVTGVTAGAAKITYTVVIEGCNTTVDDHTITVHNISEAGAKKESLMVCKGNAVLLNTANNTGVWTTSNDNIAIVDTADHVHGLSKGTATLRYTVNATCSVDNIIDLTVNDLPTVFIGKDTSFCSNTSLQLNGGDNWKSYQWNTGETSQYKTVTTAGLYSVTIRDDHDCAATDTIQIVHVFDTPVFNWNAPSALCNRKPVVLTTPANLQSVVWQDGSVGSTYTITQPGTYWAAVMDKNGCSNSDTLTIDTLIEKPSGHLTKDTVICNYDSVVLATSAPFAAYQWSTGSTQPALAAKQGGTYQLLATDRYGCSWNFSTIVTTKDCFTAIVFPNAFSPDGNGLNDYFRPKVYGNIHYFKMIIYNRWGQKLFETADWQRGWNGNINGLVQTPDTYIWTAVYELAGEKRKTAQGTFVLLR